jgi:serine/threonine-protein kinase
MEETRLGSYQLIARLGAGGMAEVYLARRDGPAGFTKYLAIKRMRPELTQHQEFVDLFAEEAKTASLLSHPNICQVHEFNASGDELYMVMEYLEGIAVSSLLIRALRRSRSLPLPIVAGIIEQACDGIHYAHEVRDEAGGELQIVHRDISPPNLLITTSGSVKLLDFGISKSRQSVVRTMTGQIRGKFAYMSPEQLRSRPLDRRSDIFSLGIVTHELVTGKRLFRRPTRLQTYHAITSEPIPAPAELRPDLPPELDAVIRRALGREPDERFATARDMSDALRRALERSGGPATAKEIGDFIGEHFVAEIESRRQLFTSPSDAEAAPLPSGADTDPTQATANLRKPAATEPDATIPGYVHTGVNTVTAPREGETVQDTPPVGAATPGSGEEP